MRVTDWDKTFPHFTPEEYFSPGGLYLFKQKNIIPCDPEIMHSVEFLRYTLNQQRELGDIECDTEIQLIMNHDEVKLRGFVTPKEWYFLRSKYQGQVYSFHLWCAADVHSPQVSPETIFKCAVTLHFRGVIQYDWGVHLDLRKGEKYIKVTG